MADSAYQKQYRQEFIAGFEQRQSLLRGCCVTEAVMKGNEAVFLVADTNGATPVTRGIDGMIPARADNLTQYTATLVEWHDKPRRTRFNIFASQGDGRRIMQEGTIGVMNRKIDQDILGELANATNDTGTATTGSVALVAKALAILGNNDVDIDQTEKMFGVISPAFKAYLIQQKEFASADYVDVKLFANGASRKMLRWMDVNWITHPNISGAGTAAELCYLFHQSAIGHAVNVGDMDVDADYNREDSYYWSRTSLFMGSKLLQNSGVVVMNHDGSAYVAS